MTVPIKDTPQDNQDLATPLPVQLTELIISASRFCQIRVTSQWLLEAVRLYVVKQIPIGEDNWRVMTSPGSSLLNGRQFATIVNVMEVASDFHSLYEVCVSPLRLYVSVFSEYLRRIFKKLIHSCIN